MFKTDSNKYRQAFLRVIFYPFYCRWWVSQISPLSFLIVTILYFVDLLSISLYFLAPVDWSTVYKVFLLNIIIIV